MAQISNRTEFERDLVLTTILQMLPDAVALFDADGRLTELNPAGRKLAGLEADDPLPEDLPNTMLAPKCWQEFDARLKATLSSGVSSQHPLRIALSAGATSHKVFECRMSRIVDRRGQHFGVVVISHDISLREEALNTIADMNAMHRAILSTVPDGMVVIDDHGSISAFSAAAEKLFGYSENEVLGRNVSLLMPSPDREAHDGYIRHFVETGEKRIIGIGRVVEGQRRDGTIFPMELAIGEARAGQHRAFTGFITDLSDRLEAEAKLHQVQSELAHASRLSAVGSLASALAHELNQPLTAVANYVSAARDFALADDRGGEANVMSEALDEAAKEAVRAGQIIRRLRDFIARGETRMESIALDKLIRDAATLGLVGAREKEIDWQIDLDSEIDKVFADRVQIQQVLINLMRNAIEALESWPTKKLVVRARPSSGDEVEISVQDSGPGIAPEIRESLFQPFAGTKAKGMGLGLSICRTIIEAHGGKLTIESPESGGVLFKFTLMRASREPDDDG